MVNAIVKEIHLQHKYLVDRKLKSIYLGGGTPSLLDKGEIDLIIKTISQYFEFNDDIEITLEANPDDLINSKLNELSNTAVNRLSIGIQSFHQKELEWMNRAHNALEAEKCILAAREYGFDNISVDLIYGIPLSTHQLWNENLQRVIEFGVPHISIYALTVEEGTALNHFVKTGKTIEAPDEWVMEQFDIGVKMLNRADYDHYEISNFAQSDHHAVHNTNYWKAVPYLGIGPSAHSYNGNTRSFNVRNNAKYLKTLAQDQIPAETEVLDLNTKYNEYILTRLRTKWGVDTRDISSFGSKYQEHFANSIGSFVKKKWVKKEDGSYYLTQEGKKYADGISAELFFLE